MSGECGYLFVIGAQRCGTSLLRDLLDEHPDFEMARPFTPETKWFLEPSRTPDAGAFVAALFDAARSPAWRGEKATSYIEHPEAADRIAAALPGARIVAIVREPIARAVSNYSFSVRNGVEDRPIDLALAPDAPRRSWDPSRFSVSPFAYLERGRYVEHLQPWLDRFGAAVTVLLLEDLIEGRATRELFASLGLSVPEPVVPPPRVNASPAPLEWPSQGVIDELRDFFAGPNGALARLLGQDLSRWRDPIEAGRPNG